jgi:outer membrane protein TolC
LNAFQEVEDQLAAQRELKTQLAAETLALQAAQRTLQIANNRYKAGLVTFLEVVIAQNAELSLERTVAQLQGQKAGRRGWVNSSNRRRLGSTECLRTRDELRR